MDQLDDVIVEVGLKKSTWERIIRVLLEIDPPTDPLLYVALEDALKVSALRQVGRADQMRADFERPMEGD